MADATWIYEVMAAIEARDADRAAAYFAEDACFHAVPNDVWFTGRAEIAKMFADQSQFSTDEKSRSRLPSPMAKPSHCSGGTLERRTQTDRASTTGDRRSVSYGTV